MIGAFVSVGVVLLLAGIACVVIQTRPALPPAHTLPLVPAPLSVDVEPPAVDVTESQVQRMIDTAATSWATGDLTRRMVRSHGLIVWECDEEGTIVLSEGSAKSFREVGLSPDGLVGQSIPHDWPLDVATWTAVKAAFRDGKVHEWMGEGPYTPGRWWLVRVVPVRRGGQRLVRGVNVLFTSIPHLEGYTT